MSTQSPSSENPFSHLRLIDPLLRALAARGYSEPTPIQVQAIPPLLEGKDLLGIAQTGTGKTAAFALPILQALSTRARPLAPRRPRALVLTPTRELASQVAESFRVYGHHVPLRHAVVYGGVGQASQVRALRAGVHVLVATPGRLLDLMGQRHVDLGEVEVFVLDEADRMLDMGFVNDVRRIVATLPARRQSLLFSATMPPEISRLAGSFLRDPVRVEVAPQATTVEQVEQKVYFVERGAKRALLAEVLKDPSIERALVFTRTKHGADAVVRHLRQAGVQTAVIHGNRSQGQREAAFLGFREGRVRVLVATDIAARGIDVPDVTHVVNFDVPNVAESYVHRIGRTARAGKSGIALSFCAMEERTSLRDIERVIRRRLDVVADHPHRSPVAVFVRPPASTATATAWTRPAARRFGGRRVRATGW